MNFKKIILAATMTLGLAKVTHAEKIKPSVKKQILIVATSHNKLGTTGKKTGAYLSEITHPYEEFTNAGYEIDLVSPKGGVIPLDGLDIVDDVNQKWMKDPVFTKKIKNSLKPKNVNIKKYSAIFYAGGHGVMFDIPNHQILQKLTAQIYEAGGVVGAVCHGPAGIVNVKLSDGKYLVAGKKVSAFTNEEEQAVGLTEQMPFLLESKLIERGALHSKVDNFKAYSLKDNRLVTGQNPASAGAVAKKIIEVLNEKSDI